MAFSGSYRVIVHFDSPALCTLYDCKYTLYLVAGSSTVLQPKRTKLLQNQISLPIFFSYLRGVPTQKNCMLFKNHKSFHVLCNAIKLHILFRDTFGYMETKKGAWQGTQYPYIVT